MQQWIDDNFEAHLALLKTLAAIPAPSHHEEKRAGFILDWLVKAGAIDAYIDEALNVILPFGCEGRDDITVYMAHTDVVFPDMTELPVIRLGDRLCAPGVGDDTANVAAILTCVNYIIQHDLRPAEPVLLVLNSCEEGLGNLKGARKLLETYGSRLAGFVSFDAYYDAVCTGAVGSHRYRVTVKTAGGHSYGNFGNPNAIERLSSLIRDLYAVKVPEGPRTTYNVGEIRGGTSVNTIAQDASMLFEYRSGDAGNLDYMKKRFEEAVRRLRDAGGAEVEVELVGERPCSQGVDPARHETLIRWAEEALKTVPGQREIPRISSSTDCNVPLSMGIPAVCFGLFDGAGAHTREEYVLPDTVLPGVRAGTEFLSHFFEID